VAKRTYQPKRIPRKREHGFLKRMMSPGGRNVLPPAGSVDACG